MNSANGQFDFKIGLAMSGAISAGAYSAGVFDFLMEALSEWEKVRFDANGRPNPGVPQHRVGIVAMSGSSAGAITAAVGATSVARGCRESEPADFGTDGRRSDPGSVPRHVLPELYKAWVEHPDFLESIDGIEPLLSNADLTGEPAIGLDGKPISKFVSLLNARSLRDVGKLALTSKDPSAPQPFLSASLHLFITMTNLRGIPYRIDFLGDGHTVEYGMMSHADRAYYRLDGVGAGDFVSAWASNSTPIVLQASSLGAGVLNNEDWNGYLTHTLTSSAFPIGLAAQQVSMGADCYKGRMFALPLDLNRMAQVSPCWPATYEQTVTVTFAGVDGGALDNDPFQLLRYTLMETPPHDEDGAHTPSKADRAVIMISPFPEPPSFELDPSKAIDVSLLAVVKRLLPTFMQNARFKPEEVVKAYDRLDASRWLIGPLRYIQPDRREPYAIACGLLGGFGGFFDREFRRHDYELGRRNCQHFLAKWFGVAPDNPAVDQAALVALPQPLNGRPPLSTDLPKGRVAVIPLYGSAARAVKIRPWPRISVKTFRDFMKAVEARRDALWKNLPGQGTGADLWLGTGWMFARSRIADAIQSVVLADLIKRNQLKSDKIRQLFREDLVPDPKEREALRLDRDFLVAYVALGTTALSVAEAAAKLDGQGWDVEARLTSLEKERRILRSARGNATGLVWIPNPLADRRYWLDLNDL